MLELAGKLDGVSTAWAGLSYQERISGGQAPVLYAISLLVVFLCLAALYESWSIPASVMLVMPLGLVGAAIAVSLRGLENDVYFQVGLLTTMGLAAKNAILIVEFAEQAEKAGKSTIDAALDAARLRPATDPDDQPRVHLRRAAARDLDRRRREEPRGHRHRRDRRHADRDRARDLLRAAVLRAGAPLVRHKRWSLPAPRPLPLPEPPHEAAHRPRDRVVVLGGCSLAPPKPQPEPAVPPSWPGRRCLSAQQRDDVAEGRLPRPVPRREAAVADRARDRHNQDVRVAVANIAAARGQLRVQRAQQFPQIGAAASASRGDRGASASGTSSGVTNSFAFDVGLSAFEIDLFGRVRSLSDAALQTLFGTEAALRAVRLSLVAEVASAYLTLAADRSLLAIAKETEQTATRSVQLTEARRAGGVAAALRRAPGRDRARDRARRSREPDHARRAGPQRARTAGRRAGRRRRPRGLDRVRRRCVRRVPAGLDSRVLLRRPDVVQAEYLLYAANARIGAARAAFFPTISLTAAAGFASGSLTSLFTRDAFAWSAGPALSLPIFDAGARRGNLDTFEAQRDAALAQYQKTIQTAFREVARRARATRHDRRPGPRADRPRGRGARQLLPRGRALSRRRRRVPHEPRRAAHAVHRAALWASIRRVRADNLVQLYRALGGSS